MRYSDHEQREMDAASGLEMDLRFEAELVRGMSLVYEVASPVVGLRMWRRGDDVWVYDGVSGVVIKGGGPVIHDIYMRQLARAGMVVER